jgi:hypothetical protein
MAVSGGNHSMRTRLLRTRLLRTRLLRTRLLRTRLFPAVHITTVVRCPETGTICRCAQTKRNEPHYERGALDVAGGEDPSGGGDVLNRERVNDENMPLEALEAGTPPGGGTPPLDFSALCDAACACMC